MGILVDRQPSSLGHFLFTKNALPKEASACLWVGSSVWTSRIGIEVFSMRDGLREFSWDFDLMVVVQVAWARRSSAEWGLLGYARAGL